MKTKTTTTYQVTTEFGINIIFEDSDWGKIVRWEKENDREHPDWRVTSYEIKSITLVETLLK